MKMILASVLALGLMTSAALAESTKSTASQSGRVVLTTAQMDSVKAGSDPLVNVCVNAVVIGKRNSQRCE